MKSAYALLAALCSSLVPGMGQMMAGRWRRGSVLLIVTLVLLGVALGMARLGSDVLLDLLVRPSVLLSLLAVNACVLCLRLFATLDAYRLTAAQPGRGRRAWATAGLGLVVVLTATPHVAAGYYNIKVYQLFSIFAAAAPPTPTPAPPTIAVSPTPAPTATVAAATPNLQPSVTPSTRPSATPSIRPSATPSASAPPPAVAVSPDQHPPSETATAPPAAVQPSVKATPDNLAQGPDAASTPWTDGDRINVLLLGGDAGPERSGLRTDTMIVASIHPSTGEAALLSVPRNLKQVPLPESLARQFPCRCWPDLLNALYGYVEHHPAWLPNSPHPGATALQQTIGNLLGIRIDHYALVDLGGFVDVIDALGGVTIDVPDHTMIRLSPSKRGGAWRTFDIPAGRQHLDGEAALAYARNRSDSSDYVRMKRQRCLLGAVAKATDTAALVRAFPRLVDVMRQRVITDIPVSELPTLIKLARVIHTDDLKTTGFVPPRYSAGATPDGYPIPNVTLIQQTARTIFGQPAHSENAVASSTVETAAQSCGWSDSR